MPSLDYPVLPNYREFWYGNFKNTDKGNLEYVEKAMMMGDSLEEAQCAINGGFLKKIKVSTYIGSKIGDITICAAKIGSKLPTDVILLRNGEIRISKQEGLSTYQHFQQFVMSVLKVAGVMEMIGLTFGIKPMLEDMNNVFNGLGKGKEIFGSWMTNAINMWQKGNAWIDDKLHVGFLLKVHKMGRVLVPEYNTYWKEQEKQLAYQSNRIFGNTTTLNTYVHLAEMVMKDMYSSLGEGDETSRYESLKHGAALMDRIGDKLTIYERQPNQVWADIMSYTYGEKNPYLDPNREAFGSDFIGQLKGVLDKVNMMNEKLDKLGLYSADLDKLNLGSLKDDIQGVRAVWNEHYDGQIKPAFRVINGMYKEQQDHIVNMQKERNKEAVSRERSFIFSKSPEELTETEKNIQSKQFMDVLHVSLPSLSSRFDFSTLDIKDFE